MTQMKTQIAASPSASICVICVICGSAFKFFLQLRQLVESLDWRERLDVDGAECGQSILFARVTAEETELSNECPAAALRLGDDVALFALQRDQDLAGAVDDRAGNAGELRYLDAVA